jgi:hypothetical protein
MSPPRAAPVGDPFDRNGRRMKSRKPFGDGSELRLTALRQHVLDIGVGHVPPGLST